MSISDKMGRWHRDKNIQENEPSKKIDAWIGDDLKKAKSGLNLNPDNLLMKTLINCHTCPHQGNPTCPHGIMKGQKHTNGYCLTWLNEVKTLWEIAGSKTKVLQISEATKNTIMLNTQFAEWFAKGKIPEQYAQIQRNQISLLDKMRKQDEGIKIQADINVGWKEFQDVVDVQAKAIVDEKRDIIKEAELVEEQNKEKTDGDNRQDNGRGKEQTKEEV